MCKGAGGGAGDGAGAEAEAEADELFAGEAFVSLLSFLSEMLIDGSVTCFCTPGGSSEAFDETVARSGAAATSSSAFPDPMASISVGSFDIAFWDFVVLTLTAPDSLDRAVANSSPLGVHVDLERNSFILPQIRAISAI